LTMQGVARVPTVNSPARPGPRGLGQAQIVGRVAVSRKMITENPRGSVHGSAPEPFRRTGNPGITILYAQHSLSRHSNAPPVSVNRNRRCYLDDEVGLNSATQHRPPRTGTAASSFAFATASSSSVSTRARPFTLRHVRGHASKVRGDTGKYSRVTMAAPRGLATRAGYGLCGGSDRVNSVRLPVSAMLRSRFR